MMTKKIALICGSIQKDSFSAKVLREVFTKYQNENVQLDYIDFNEYELPFFDGSNECREKAARFAQKIDASDGYIIISPEYHNSFSGVLKNAFDFLNGSQFKGKPVAIMSTSGGGKGGINCLNAMRLFLRGLYAMVLPDQLVINKCDMIDEDKVSKVFKLVDDTVDFLEFRAYQEKSSLKILQDTK